MEHQPPPGEARTIHRFCISHEEPLLPESWFDDCIALGDYRRGAPCHVGQLDEFWDEARPIAYGAAGSHVLPTAISRFAGTADLIEVSGYRRRLFAHPVGDVCLAVHGTWELQFDVDSGGGRRRFGDLPDPGVLADVRPRSESGFLVARPMPLNASLLASYAYFHHGRDLVDYLGIAVEQGVLAKESTRRMLLSRHMVLGGIELGVYPAPWLAEQWQRIGSVSREFLRRYGGRVRGYDGYQVRAVHFLSERLGSFLLLRHLRDTFGGTIPEEVFGYPVVVTERGSEYSAGMTA